MWHWKFQGLQLWSYAVAAPRWPHLGVSTCALDANMEAKRLSHAFWRSFWCILILWEYPKTRQVGHPQFRPVFRFSVLRPGSSLVVWWIRTAGPSASTSPATSRCCDGVRNQSPNGWTWPNRPVSTGRDILDFLYNPLSVSWISQGLRSPF